MFSVTYETTIDVEPEEAYSFLDDPRNHVRITPGLIDVRDVERLSAGGKRATYRYELAGVTLSGTVEDVDRDPPELLVQSLSGAIDGTIAYELDSVDGGTCLHYEAEYELPETVVDTVLSPIAAAYNEREAKSTVENLRTHLEY